MVEIIAQLETQLNKSKNRIIQLKQSSFELNKKITHSSNNEKTNNSDEKETANNLNKDILELESELKETIKIVVLLSSKFKNLVKKEHLAHLKSRVDEWPLESFITRKEFNELIKTYQQRL